MSCATRESRRERCANCTPTEPAGGRNKADRKYQTIYEAFLTVSCFLPFRRRAASTRRPPGVAVRSKNPWVRALFRLFGWYVTDIMVYYIGIYKKMQGATIKLQH